MNATDDISRLFRMIPWLAQRQGVAVTTAAQEFGITPQRLIHELSALCVIGSDVDEIARGSYEYLLDFDVDEAENGRIFVTPSEYVARPLRLTQDEALSLLVALRSLQHLVDEESAAHVASATAKLEELTDPDGGHVEIQVDHGADNVRHVIAGAIRDAAQLQIVYDGVNRGLTSRPIIDPVALIVRDGSAYLQAYSRTSDGWRLFKVNRIAEASRTGQPRGEVGTPPEAEWVDADDLGTVEVHLAAGALYLLEYDPVREFGELDDPVYLRWARLPLADHRYLTNRLLRLADDIRLAEPHAAQRDAVAIAEAALARYEQLDDAPGAGR